MTAMQCNHAFFGTPTGVPNCGPIPCNPTLNYNGFYPNVIGEGEVVSVMYPNGCIQFYFIPSPRRCTMTYPYNLDTMNNPYWNNNTGAWIVKSISNPIPMALFNHQTQRMNGVIWERPDCNSNCNVLPAEYQLKFHNDNWTSTTDLHCFCPSLRIEQHSKETSAMEVIQPTKSVSVHYFCDKPCHCKQNKKTDTRKSKCSSTSDSSMSFMQDVSYTCKNACYCLKKDMRKHKHKKRHEVKSSDCNMSVTGNDTSSKEKVSKRNKTKSFTKKDRRKKKRNDSCGCERQKSDKQVTTYADQASDCTPNKGCETQTSLESNKLSSKSSSKKNKKKRDTLTPTSSSEIELELCSSCSHCLLNCCGSSRG